MLRELWLRTQNERPYRRFYVLPDTTAEIMENTREQYRNTHYREEYLEESPVPDRHPDHPGEGGGPGGGERDEVRKPRKNAPFANRTILISGWSGNDVHATEKSSFTGISVANREQTDRPQPAKYSPF